MHGQRGPCHKCGQRGHIARECTVRVCWTCQQQGHLSGNCPLKEKIANLVKAETQKKVHWAEGMAVEKSPRITELKEDGSVKEGEQA